MKNLKIYFLSVILMALASEPANSQVLELSRDEMIKFTSQWEGERFPDGRPRVPDDIIERMKLVSLEEAWGVMNNAGYRFQFERGWKHVHPGEILVGRAMPVMYMPKRPGLHDIIDEEGEAAGRIGNQVSWPIDMLVKGDVYVADVYGRTEGGPIIGGNLGNSIFAKTGNGVVVNGEVRDLDQLEKIEGFNAFVRDWNPHYYWSSTIIGINIPTRIGAVTVLPGDVVLGNREGVLFIPPHLAEKVVKTSELVRLKDAFGIMCLQEGLYPPGLIDGKWNDEINAHFNRWLEDHIDELPVPRDQIEEILRERTW